MYNNVTELSAYYYHRNLQGDVIAIYDANGEKQVEYAYDAWGNCEIVYGENSNLASLNPIRYRGYYYDTETGLYYLNARYYSPEWRRFISPDAAEYIDPETPNGLNLYAYCYNDPVNYADPSGHFIISSSVLVVTAFIGAALGAVSGAVYGGLTAAANGQNIWAGVGLGLLTGAIMGTGAGVASLFIAPIIAGEGVVFSVAGATLAVSAGSSVAIGFGVAFATGAVGGIISDMHTQRLKDGEISDWGSVVISALQWGGLNVLSAVLGSIGGPLSDLEAAFVTSVFNNVTGVIGLAIDVARGMGNETTTVRSSLYRYSY